MLLLSSTVMRLIIQTMHSDGLIFRSQLLGLQEKNKYWNIFKLCMIYYC